MSFVSLPSNPPAPDDPTASAPITGDGFFPDIDPVAMREAYRISKSVPPQQLRAALIGAIITASVDLGEWAATQQTAGFATLAAVPAAQIDGQSRLVQLYARAVGLRAKAELIERYRDFDTTAAGAKPVEALTETVDDLRRDAAHAVRDMLGRTRTMVELI